VQSGDGNQYRAPRYPVHFRWLDMASSQQAIADPCYKPFSAPVVQVEPDEEILPQPCLIAQSICGR
jgi:hypothetical protein